MLWRDVCTEHAISTSHANAGIWAMFTWSRRAQEVGYSVAQNILMDQWSKVYIFQTSTIEVFFFFGMEKENRLTLVQEGVCWRDNVNVVLKCRGFWIIRPTVFTTEDGGSMLLWNVGLQPRTSKLRHGRTSSDVASLISKGYREVFA